MSIQKLVGHNIVKTRKQKGVTQEVLANDTDMSVAYLRRIEHGTANPTLKALYRISTTLEVPLQTLFCVSDLNDT